MANDQERAAFEAAATKCGFSPEHQLGSWDGEDYEDMSTHIAFYWWRQARAALAAAPVQAVPDAWRKLALQFDGQRMQALAHLRAMLQDPAAHADVAKAFLAAAPAAPVQAVPADVDLPDVDDMAHSALQEALTFGLNHDVVARFGRLVRDKTVAAMLAAAPAAPQAPAVPHWRDIETAPKDGTAILVFAGGFCSSVEWSEEFDWWTVDDNKNGPYRLRGLAPTHWMPLPASPSAAPQPAGGAQGDEDLQTRYELVRSWHADDQRRVNLLVQHLRAVLEVARTWQPDYATKMDRDTLDLAAAEVGHEPLNAQAECAAKPSTQAQG